MDERDIELFVATRIIEPTYAYTRLPVCFSLLLYGCRCMVTIGNKIRTLFRRFRSFYLLFFRKSTDFD